MKTSRIFIENLKRLRKERFPTQEDFAPLVNLSTRGYQKYETGESSPTPDIIDRFSAKLGCKPWELVTASTSDSHGLSDAADLLKAYAGANPDIRKVILTILYDDASYVETVSRQSISRALKSLSPALKLK